MNYYKLHDSIISRAQSRKLPVGTYIEKHHIIPKCFGGTNDKSNLVSLSFREHYLIHKLLVNIYEPEPVKYKKMLYAFWQMSMSHNTLGMDRVRSFSRDYERARTLFARNNPNKDSARKLRVAHNRLMGLYKYDYDKVGRTLAETLSKLTDSEMDTRMRHCRVYDEKRNMAVRKGKASHLQVTYPDGTSTTFFSWEDTLPITGYKYQNIKYIIKNRGGVCLNGNKLEYIKKYEYRRPIRE